MAFVGFAVFVGGHAHNLVAFHLGFKGAANTAVGAGGGNGMLGLAGFNNAFFGECCGGTGIDTGATGNTFGVHKVFGLAGADFGFKPSAING